MTKSQAPSASTNATSSLSTFLSNVHLLDLDRSEDWPAISAQTFTSKNTLLNEKYRIHCVEWAFYRLFELWDPEETKDKLQPFFPPLEPLQSLNLRAALFKCLSELKKNGDLGKAVILRKSLFDDCKVEKVQELLASFSTIVLRKILILGNTGKVSIAGRLAVAKKVTSKEHGSFLPLAIAHRASLTGLLRRKKELKARYQSFGRTLDTKEKELDRRFEGVVQTQGILDENELPDTQVSRLSLLFEKHWQGNSGLVNVIAQGEEHGLGDSLLDWPFQDVWPEVSNGTFGGEINPSHQGLLENLERRVAEQESRLNQWKDFKEAMQRDSKLRTLPKKQDLSFTRSRSNEQERRQRRERDLVFSPRKSPRKSDWELKDLQNQESPTPALPKTPKAETRSSRSVLKQLSFDSKTEEADHGPESQGMGLADQISVNDPSYNDSHNSSFSEVLGDYLHELASPDHALRLKDIAAFPVNVDQRNGSNEHENRDDSPSTPPNKHVTLSAKHTLSDTPSERDAENSIPDEDDLLAEQIISMTLNAAPTPAKPKLSLSERTRQSIAFASPSKFRGLRPDGCSPPLGSPVVTYEDSHVANISATTTTLLERTRQSISLLPTNPKAKPRISMHKRRNSKIYPKNPFETPRKQVSKAKGLTPPEELFSPGAGYDSVFKSRPKVANSPAPSLSPGLEDGEGKGEREGENLDGETSRSARGVGRV